jgi:hypothetical protein
VEGLGVVWWKEAGWGDATEMQLIDSPRGRLHVAIKFRFAGFTVNQYFVFLSLNISKVVFS